MRSAQSSRKDSNHHQIVSELRDAGLDVLVSGDGMYDIAIGHKGCNYFYEIKKDKNAKLTKYQEEFAQRWNGHWKRVESTEEILLDLKLIQFPKPRLQDEIA